ncbi:UDP-N-acetylmuramoyl-L-alanyl-D-glutamate--2,6-diaminopimelate ligase [Betaproteobacteria bacterium]|nr:UDP-N-acetylmuramoyl-L-alanyl-D-glutamate--2,6-diaminopimelate ligase [Betaproteobacteria bacterium]
MAPIYNYSRRISVDWNPKFKDDAIAFGQKISHLFPNSNLTDNTKFLKKGDVFVLLPGENFGVDFLINKIRDYSPHAIITDKKIRRLLGNLPQYCKTFFWENLKDYIGFIAAGFYNNPSDELNVTAVTGTDGKTTVVNLAASILANSFEDSAAIGTLGVVIYRKNQKEVVLQDYGPSNLTTPSAVILQGIFDKLRNEKIGKVFLEASSIGIITQRLQGTNIKTAVFTNLGSDHLDLHGNLGNLAYSKSQLFSHPALTNIVFTEKNRFKHSEIQLVYETIEKSDAKKISVGIKAFPDKSSNLTSKILVVEKNVSRLGTLVSVIKNNEESEPFIIKIFGKHNLENLSLVAGILADNLTVSNAGAILRDCRLPEGRFDLLDRENLPLVCIDFAHTPESLKVTLQTLDRLKKKSSSNLICVFGCGGNRDIKKRPVMGKIAASYADHGYITSDNPREESIDKISQDIMSGICLKKKSSWLPIPDRRKAIEVAITKADKNDIVLIAGKGHEKTQQIKGVLFEFCDKRVVEELIEKGIN